MISDAVEYVANVSNPMKIALRTQRLETISEAQSKDVAVRIAYAAKHANIANSWKKWQGESLGLERLGTIEKKQRYEARFAAWAATKPEYSTLLDSMRAAYASNTRGYFVRELFNESVGAIEAYGIAHKLRQATSATAEEQLAYRRKLLKDYNKEIDRTIARRMLTEFMARMPKENIPQVLTDEIKTAAAYRSI